MPDATPFYNSVLRGMSSGFLSKGFNVLTYPRLLDATRLYRFCKHHKPDIVFEMNRVRDEIPELDPKIKHISWIVDLQGRDLNQLQGSDILYLFGTGWKDIHQNISNRIVDWLPPGVCQDTYFFDRKVEHCDVSFIGHIPAPWTRQELDRSIFNNKNYSLTFGELLAECKNEWSKHGGLHSIDFKTNTTIINRIISQYGDRKKIIDDTKLRYDIQVRSARVCSRQELMHNALDISKDIKIFGTPNWSKWRAFKPYYKKFLYRCGHIRNVYQSSRLNLHNGIGIHFRSLDCMASGGVIVYRSTSRDNHHEGINSHFEPFRHYIPLNDDYEKVRFYLNNPNKRYKISKEASELVKQKHTWAKRCEKITQDLKRL